MRCHMDQKLPHIGFHIEHKNANVALVNWMAAGGGGAVISSISTEQYTIAMQIQHIYFVLKTQFKFKVHLCHVWHLFHNGRHACL